MPQAEENSRKHSGIGHRARLRERLLSGGAEALADYEVLEYLLFAGMRQGDTKPIAKELLQRFGSFNFIRCNIANKVIFNGEDHHCSLIAWLRAVKWLLSGLGVPPGPVR